METQNTCVGGKKKKNPQAYNKLLTSSQMIYLKQLSLLKFLDNLIITKYIVLFIPY